MTFLRTGDDWRDRANCRGASLDAFFPLTVRATRDQCAEALAYCSGCQVTGNCLDLALRTRSGGVYGGTTEFERDVILRRERAAEREAEEVAS